MNFLAHAYLSGDNTKVMVGNFMGDFVKGRAYEKFEPDIAKGIQLHRFIDSYTDGHPLVLQSKDRLRAKYRHYAGVIVDIFYDHFLAAQWEKHHDQQLLSFTHHVYRSLDNHEDILPDKMKFMLKYMKRDNWMYHYASIEGTQQALTGMSRRARFKSNMEHAAKDLQTGYHLYEQEFEAFLPEARQAATDWLLNH